MRDAAARVDAPVVAQDAAGNVAMDAGSDPEAGGAGCGLAVPSGDATWTLTSGGLTRTLTVHVPASYDPAQTTPLVLDFHGEFSDGAQQDELSGMSAKADAEGFIAMFPEGIGGSWNAGGDCCGTALQENVDDVGFVSDILETAAVRLCVDPRRVFVTGMSNGAYLAQRLGCALADRIAAIAPVAGVLSVQRAVSVPLGITTPGQPNISSTIWRTVADQKNLVYYFDSATRPNTFWVTLNKADLKAGAPVKELVIAHGEVFSGEVAGDFKVAKPFTFLPATPP